MAGMEDMEVLEVLEVLEDVEVLTLQLKVLDVRRGASEGPDGRPAGASAHVGTQLD